MYITNDPSIAGIAHKAGVDRVFLDMESIGKAERQCGMDTVLCSHTIDDIKNIRAAVPDTELLVRCNSIHSGSEQEINDIIEAGANVVMLPYFKTAAEAKQFIGFVGGRARVNLLIETAGALEQIDEILALDGIDEVHIGINDLSISYGQSFLFEPLADGKVDYLCGKFREKRIPYGFGGIASLGKGKLQSEHVIMEHYRLGSTIAILSRSFCNATLITDLNEIRSVFGEGVRKIREYEEYCRAHPELREENRKETVRIVEQIAKEIKR
jgi:hypothetical protein